MNRSDKEETGLSTDFPVRGEESDTYWNTRFLTHSILGKHYRTPQYNLELLKEYLNLYLPSSNQIDKKPKFQAKGLENLRFPLINGVITFNAHQPINVEDFFKQFRIKRL